MKLEALLCAVHLLVWIQLGDQLVLRLWRAVNFQVLIVRSVHINKRMRFDGYKAPVRFVCLYGRPVILRLLVTVHEALFNEVAIRLPERLVTALLVMLRPELTACFNLGLGLPHPFDFLTHALFDHRTSGSSIWSIAWRQYLGDGRLLNDDDPCLELVGLEVAKSRVH